MFPDGVDEREEWFQNNCPHCYRGHDKEGRPISCNAFRMWLHFLALILLDRGKNGRVSAACAAGRCG